jgi:hypothetical protein
VGGYYWLKRVRCADPVRHVKLIEYSSGAAFGRVACDGILTDWLSFVGNVGRRAKELLLWQPALWMHRLRQIMLDGSKNEKKEGECRHRREWRGGMTGKDGKGRSRTAAPVASHSRSAIELLHRLRALIPSTVLLPFTDSSLFSRPVHSVTFPVPSLASTSPLTHNSLIS